MPMARIFKPAKTSTQSGRAKTKKWCLMFDRSKAKFIEPLMGWMSSHDTQGQVKLYFKTKEDAVMYATKRGIEFDLQEEQTNTHKPKNYPQNFKPML